MMISNKRLKLAKYLIIHAVFGLLISVILFGYQIENYGYVILGVMLTAIPRVMK